MSPNVKSFVGGTKYGVISWSNYLHIALVLISMPLTLTLKTLFSFAYAPRPAHAYALKPLKRRIADTIARSAFSGLSILETQWALGPGPHVYQQWAKGYKLDCTIDKLHSDLEEDKSKGHLLWIGPKRTDKVVLVIPGGAFLFPATEMMFKFWRYAQLEWEKKGLAVGIAILSYGLLPEDEFPIQLQQTTRAIEYLFAIGCDPSNLQLVGDSAGGNLIFQLFSHLLHPLPSHQVPPLSLPSGKRLRGAYTMSPWVSLSNPEQWGNSIHAKAYYDVTTGIHKQGQLYMAQVPDSYTTYAEPILVPNDWYSGLNNIVDRILVSTGTEERLFDQDVAFFETKIKSHHRDAALEIQAGGLHDDPILDFFFFDAPLENTLTPTVLEWIAKGFQ
ncbi:hypothetical protein GYMLUDRAFT_238888 [Collybiopsis luxurians FD-317 M1]|nr:hypothetical protein GYMLUDRAFT_238888 [Collybiopsis luxurians FD-317 M1]